MPPIALEAKTQELPAAPRVDPFIAFALESVPVGPVSPHPPPSEGTSVVPRTDPRKLGKQIVFAGFVLGFVGVGAVALLMGRENAGPPAPEPLPVAAPAAPPVAAGEAVVDAGVALAAAPDEPPPPAVFDEPPPKPAPAPAPRQPAKATRQPVPALGKKGLVEFRVKPYADVFVNGTPYGATPLRHVELPAGPAQVRLVNKELEMDVTLTWMVKPGKSVFKYNLGD